MPEFWKKRVSLLFGESFSNMTAFVHACANQCYIAFLSMFLIENSRKLPTSDESYTTCTLNFIIAVK
jgi:hypothetical protein